MEWILVALIGAMIGLRLAARRTTEAEIHVSANKATAEMIAIVSRRPPPRAANDEDWS